MIYYFTGTGNSLCVARQLAEETGEGLASIAEIMRGKPFPEPGRLTGIVYPVFAWAPPKIVVDFVKQYRAQLNTDYIFSVCTAGGSCVGSMTRLEKALGRPLDSAYCLIMPNNFMIGMDVDAGEAAEKKLKEAQAQIPSIAKALLERKQEISGIKRGALRMFMSAAAESFFNTFALSSAHKFYAKDSCNACRLCGEVCPTENIQIDQKPLWGKDCTLCFACINHCPVKAIQYGKGTEKKGRYVNPNCRVSYDFPKSSE